MSMRQFLEGSRPLQELAHAHAPILRGVHTPPGIGACPRANAERGVDPSRSWRMPMRQFVERSGPLPELARAHAPIRNRS